MISSLRVRHILSTGTMDSKDLKKLLPKKLSVPDVSTLRYPHALLSQLPKEESYSLLGFITEELLRSEPEAITMDQLEICIQKWYPEISSESIIKIKKSVTTPPFLDAVKQTRIKVDQVRRGELQYDTECNFEHIQGHPDMITPTQVFEVKMTGQLKENWTCFLFQVFAYASLLPEVTDVYLVLPMQQMVWHYPLEQWKDRIVYRERLNQTSLFMQTEQKDKLQQVSQLFRLYTIGWHMKKQKTMEMTMLTIEDPQKPYQVFLGGPQSTSMSITEEDMKKTKTMVDTVGYRMYVHSQYLINLCSDDMFPSDLLIRNLIYAKQMNYKGVVVHTGKYMKKEINDAIGQMSFHLARAMEHATEECPILLETPSGQGTETLVNSDEFISFVHQFDDPRLRICIDTCHVFASGMDPLSYIMQVEKINPALIQLIHLNDSKAPCGSCVDRHETIGLGHIGMEKMTDITRYCFTKGYPMIHEG